MCSGWVVRAAVAGRPDALALGARVGCERGLTLLVLLVDIPEPQQQRPVVGSQVADASRRTVGQQRQDARRASTSEHERWVVQTPDRRRGTDTGGQAARAPRKSEGSPDGGGCAARPGHAGSRGRGVAGVTPAGLRHYSATGHRRSAQPLSPASQPSLSAQPLSPAAQPSLFAHQHVPPKCARPIMRAHSCCRAAVHRHAGSPRAASHDEKLGHGSGSLNASMEASVEAQNALRARLPLAMPLPPLSADCWRRRRRPTRSPPSSCVW